MNSFSSCLTEHKISLKTSSTAPDRWVPLVTNQSLLRCSQTISARRASVWQISEYANLLRLEFMLTTLDYGNNWSSFRKKDFLHTSSSFDLFTRNMAFSTLFLLLQHSFDSLICTNNSNQRNGENPNQTRKISGSFACKYIAGVAHQKFLLEIKEQLAPAQEQVDFRDWVKTV